MQILFSRHGNTFGPQDKVVWAGSKNDFPLVESGIAQAENCAKALLDAKIKLSAIYCGPLSRTRNYAQIIHSKLGLKTPGIVEDRLDEIDFGDWSGMSNEEVIAKYGPQEIEAWNNHSKWPVVGNWDGSEQQAIAAAQLLMQDLLQQFTGDDTILLVSSNGKLRYFLTLIPGEFEHRQQNGLFKMKTGNMGKMVYDKGNFTVEFWDKNPLSALCSEEHLSEKQLKI